MTVSGSAKEPASLTTVLKRALCWRCPNCGEGKLFSSYLKPVSQCAVCGEAWGLVRADDGPAWLSILIVGHIVVPLLVMAVADTDWPDWVILSVFGSLTTALVVGILPFAKAIFIAIIWRTKGPGSAPAAS